MGSLRVFSMVKYVLLYEILILLIISFLNSWIDLISLSLKVSMLFLIDIVEVDTISGAWIDESIDETTKLWGKLFRVTIVDEPYCELEDSELLITSDWNNFSDFFLSISNCWLYFFSISIFSFFSLNILIDSWLIRLWPSINIDKIIKITAIIGVENQLINFKYFFTCRLKGGKIMIKAKNSQLMQEQ